MNAYQRQRLQDDAAKEQGEKHRHRTACATACCEAFGASLSGCYLHTIDDICRVLRRSGYAVRSRRSSVPKQVTVGGLRKLLPKLEVGAYLVRVDGHALVMAHDGRTLVDTDPRKVDRRRVTHLYRVVPKNLV